MLFEKGKADNFSLKKDEDTHGVESGFILYQRKIFDYFGDI